MDKKKTTNKTPSIINLVMNDLEYSHTQRGTLIIIIIAILIAYFGFIFSITDFDPVMLLILILVIIILSSFTYLNVSIDKQYLRIKFGWGLFKKKFFLRDIVSAKTAKHNWWNGWGIRYSFKPKMWIYNISGFQVIEIKLKNSKVYRIGTDQPKELEQALNK